MKRPTSNPASLPSRRSLLKFAASAAPLVLASRVLGLEGKTAPSNRITIGFIGVGGHGLGHNLANFLQQDDAQLVAVNDVFASRRAQAKQTIDKKYGNKDCREYAHFSEVIAQKNIDVICISTPDHWHVPLSIMAVEAGKDVLCEKPTLTIAEGRALADLVAKKKTVYQVGIEDRSVIQYHMLAAWVRNGAIGDLKKITVGLPSGQVVPKEEPIPVPEDLDYKTWLGPLVPFRPYTKSLTKAMIWRQIRDFSGGMLTDWGSHLMDTAQVANFAEESGPVEVEGQGKIPENAMTTTAPQFRILYKYANGVEMEVKSGGVLINFEGTTGWVGNKGWRGRLEASDEKVLHIKYDEGKYGDETVPSKSKLWPLPPNEHRDFLNCVKSRKPTTYTAEHGQRLSTAMHIGNISIELGRKLKWDPKAERFVGDEEANKLLTRPGRAEWKV